MLVYASTVIRGAELDKAGHLYLIDWDRGEVLRQLPVPLPIAPEAGPRGSRRGGRGICTYGDYIVASNYDSLLLYTRDLQLVKRLTHPLFCGIHEIAACREGIWVSSTGIEALLLYDMETEEVVRSHFLTETPEFAQPPVSVNLRAIDRGVDYRSIIYSRSELSTHTNCVQVDGDTVYALLSNKKMLVQLEPKREVYLHGEEMREPHNTVFVNGSVLINDTGNQTVRIFDARTGRQRAAIDLNRLGLVIKREGTRLKGMLKISVPGWLRGMSAISEERILVGISPSTVVELDVPSQRVVKTLVLSDDINNSIHGLCFVAESLVQA